MIGQVVKASSDTFVVNVDSKKVNCRARGRLKLKRDGICVGDFVEINRGAITEVKERKNKFIRPNVANIDQIVAVISHSPKPDLLLLDKLILNATKENVEVIIVINKSDLESSIKEQIYDEYSNLPIKIYSLSALKKQGINEFRALLSGKLTLLAGQSAVGKTSLVNALFDFNLKTGDLSEKIERGKHTTTRSEIFEIGDIRLIDSPGFAVLEAFVSLSELPECYEEYFKYSNQCKYRGCSHTTEPNCKVKEMVESGVLSKERYQRYLKIYNEIASRRVDYEKD